jgi:hypothetical protein
MKIIKENNKQRMTPIALMWKIRYFFEYDVSIKLNDFFSITKFTFGDERPPQKLVTCRTACFIAISFFIIGLII